MAVDYYRGTRGAVAFGKRNANVAQPFTEWSLTVTTPEIDQSDYDQPTAKHAAGISTAAVSLSGPYPDVPLNIKSGDLTTVTLYLDHEDDIGFTLPILVTSLGLRMGARGVAQMELTGLCQGNFTDGDTDTGDIKL
jgi:hypothetical protein